MAAEDLGSECRLLELAPAEPLGFAGGQYIIVDTGLVLASGKAVKRAYSIWSRDADEDRFRLAVKRIPGGPGSGYLHALDAGAEVRFSGPWGKLLPAPGARGATLVLATDTGVTAALGLLGGTRFAPLLPATVFVWLRCATEAFLSEPIVRESIPRGCGEVRLGQTWPIGHAERIPQARALLAEILRRSRVEQAFLAGDGAVNYALLDDLCAAGVAATRDSVESFFNMPRKAAP